MGKFFWAASITLSIVVCGSALGFYVVKSVFPVVQVDPFYDEVSSINSEFAREQDSTWALMERGTERSLAKEEWRKRYARSIKGVYRRYKKEPPEWVKTVE